ncbi:MAG: methyltransferase domain-containing protein [Deltaproteobacteria bacterium]|nr:methyltransferase domain-containing protein [Deltaproteobacteria bacterium]
MGHVFDLKDANSYEDWLAKGSSRAVLETETALMLSMLRPVPGESLLDIGCGTGASLSPFLGRGISLTGIEPSPNMLDYAKQRLGSRVDLHRGYAEDLPFDDNSFNCSIFFLSLEFVDDPAKAIEEACRVTKDRIFIGIINKYSMYGAVRRIRAMFGPTLFRHARFFSIFGIQRILFNLLGEVPFSWKTALHTAGLSGGLLNDPGRFALLEKNPFGAFAAMVAVPIPHYRTIALPLLVDKVRKAPTGEQVASCSGDFRRVGKQ